MQKRLAHCVGLIALAACASPKGVEPAVSEESEKFHAEVVRLFGSGGSMPSPQQDAQITREIEAFEQRLLANPERSLPLLRSELRRDVVPPIFAIESASLLLQWVQQDTPGSDPASDYPLLAEVMGRCDPLYVNDGMYFGIVHELARQGCDVTECVHRILDLLNFRVPLPQHAMTVGRLPCIVVLTILMPERMWLESMSTRLFEEEEEATIRCLIVALQESVTDQGFAAIARYAEAGRSSGERQFCRKIGKRIGEVVPRSSDSKVTRIHLEAFLRDLVANRTEGLDYDPEAYRREAEQLVQEIDYKLIERLRRSLARRMSDESLPMLMYFSRLLFRAYQAGL